MVVAAVAMAVVAFGLDKAAVVAIVTAVLTAFLAIFPAFGPVLAALVAPVIAAFGARIVVASAAPVLSTGERAEAEGSGEHGANDG
ncbi:MAG: hypothetical protein EOO24_17260 [Comamonadaceae bacterium]|nr:MAG: hypothetical protein EOO24_17260 [Comamonadaceae bacterium]